MRVSGQAAGSCEGTPPTATEPVTISWDPVTTSHPSVGRSGPVTIVEYVLVIEDEEAEDGGELIIELPASVTQFQIPAEFTGLGREFTVELGAVADTENTTEIEGCFKVAG